ncbi:ATPase associated with various cellular activities AAA_3 [Methanocaldococcus infernus ME]|uniref:ATPase associated with various cellular activities AAA_3 n=1 Tax=Methanocaldococcus infernus (strain DSM 11812 / JCM 15783 / ME) TaxID=573063 RepID=D5VTK1_METIM|nr:MoxR family ATPase [Methanocaldococcus infernus]ADG13904.1 ATPase associated with various cellular activities AAA_3 [Methanocaldococcus infernus ME]
MNGKQFYEKILKELRKCIVGYEDVIKFLTISILVGGHVLLEGYPGLGKTTLAKNFAKLFNLKFSRIQMVPDLLPSDITGFYYFNQKTQEFEFREGPIFANIVLVDEINRASPKTQASLLEAMEEKTVTVEGKTFKLPEPFMVIATQNPLEFAGVYELPKAEIDRFMFKLTLEYPKLDNEKQILYTKVNGDKKEVNQIFTIDDLKKAMNDVKNVKVSEKILDYICRIAKETRIDERIEYGISPRASEHILLASKANAYLEGRSYVIPDDVKAVAKYCIPHRIVVNREYDIDERELVEEILNKVKVVE